MTRHSVFIHSTGTGPFMWDAVPEAVLAGGDKVCPRNLGYPPGAPVERGTPVTVRDDAATCLAQIPDGGDVHLFGHSYGGLVAVQVAKALGPRVKSLFLYEPVLMGALVRDQSVTISDPGVVEEVRGFQEHPWFLTDDTRGGTDAWLEVFIDYWNRPGSWSRMPPRMREMSLRVGWKMYQEVREVFFSVSAFEECVVPGVPTTLVLGEKTTRASRAMTTTLAARTPESVLVELPVVGHMAPLTHPEPVGVVMQQHVARVG